MANALRRLTRENLRLRTALGAMLEEAEATAITSFWPHGDHPPGEPRLCKVLADEMRHDDPPRRHLPEKAGPPER